MTDPTNPDKLEAKLPMLIKLMGMTQSEQDGEALAFLRKANKIVKDAGWTWEKILLGKVKVIADPFTNIQAPPPKPNSSRGTTPSQPSTPNRSGYGSTVPPKPQAPRPKVPHSTFPNKYVGHCWQCGNFVDTGKGWLVRDPSGRNQFVVLCDYDNRDSSIPLRPTRTKRQKPSTSSILNGI